MKEAQTPQTDELVVWRINDRKLSPQALKELKAQVCQSVVKCVYTVVRMEFVVCWPCMRCEDHLLHNLYE